MLLGLILVVFAVGWWLRFERGTSVAFVLIWCGGFADDGVAISDALSIFVR